MVRTGGSVGPGASTCDHLEVSMVRTAGSVGSAGVRANVLEVSIKDIGDHAGFSLVCELVSSRFR